MQREGRIVGVVWSARRRRDTLSEWTRAGSVEYAVMISIAIDVLSRLGRTRSRFAGRIGKVP
jgi:hypothetical protein